MIENPDDRETGDVLSNVLRTIRVSGSLQFCFMPTGAWQTDPKSSMKRLAASAPVTMPFHILVEGSCWLRMEDQQVDLVAGDVVAFPFGTPHDLGAGENGRFVHPTGDLPPKPWREIPTLRYGDDSRRVRLLCGYLQCDATNFRPLQDALPKLLHARTGSAKDAEWLCATIRQIVSEVEKPRTGGISMLERLTEITFIELLRHQITKAQPGSTGWIAALADPALQRCLALIHDDPRREWSVQELAAASGVSRSTLAERFEAVLKTSPIRYVRDWRLYLASVELSTTAKSIAGIAHDAGYGTEAAFNRAFSRAYGTPPAAWRQNTRQASAAG